MRKRITLLSLLIAILLSGCTVTSNRIYVVCKEDENVKYCYSNTGDFYRLENDKLIPTSSVGLKDLPALVLSPSEGVYKFSVQLPGLYKGTLTSVNHYSYKLCEGDTSRIRVSYRDWNNIEFYVECDTYSARIIFNIRGDVRMYFINEKKEPIEPLYLS